jgi:hypothetical protein
MLDLALCDFRIKETDAARALNEKVIASSRCRRDYSTSMQGGLERKLRVRYRSIAPAKLVAELPRRTTTGAG